MKTVLPESVRSPLLVALLALGLALALVVASALNAQRSLAELNDMADTRGRARAARLHVEQTLSLFKDVETGMRGFLLTGQEAYLDPYRAARAALPASYVAFRVEVSAVLTDSIDWQVLDTEIGRRFDIVGRLIDLRRQQSADRAAEQALLADGKASMDVIRARFADLDARIAQRLSELDHSVEALRMQAYRSDWLSAGVAVSLVLLATALLLRERQMRIRLEDELRTTNRTLDQRVNERTHQLSDARDRIAGFAGELSRGIEAERRRLSREVHDQIGQVFSAIRMILRGLPAGAIPADQSAVLERAIDEGVATARRIAAELRPPLLDDLGLQAALTHFVDGLFAGQKMNCEVSIADEGALGEIEALALFRIAQEACSNVLRHAGASCIGIHGGVEGAYFHLDIVDNGCGPAADGGRAGALGIIGMQERAALLGGDARIGSAEGGGTRVSIRIPLHRKNQEGNDENPAP